MEMKKETFIIFGTEHGNPLGLVRSLGEQGIAPVGIILLGMERIASLSRYWKTCHLVESVEEGYALLLEKYGTGDKKAFLYATDDGITRYLNNHYDALKEHFCFNCVRQNGKLGYYMEKANILRLAEKHGLSTAQYWEVDRGEIPEDIQYPVITKAGYSFTGDWKADSFVCHSEEELQTAYEKIASQRVMLQRYVDKKTELTLEGFSVQEGRKSAVAVAVRFLDVTAESYGRYMTVSPSIDKELEKRVFEMLEEIGYEGLFEAEFLVGKNDELYFLEINFRSSIWNYSATVAGVPLPLVWAEAMMEPERVEELCPVPFAPFTAMDELNDLRDRVLTHQLSFGQWLSDLQGCRCRYYLGRKDWMPMVSMLFGAVKRKAKRMILK